MEKCYNEVMENERDQLHGTYRHFKGNLYSLEGIGYDSETKEKLVIYKALYDDQKVWCRPYDMFFSEVDHEQYPDVKQKYRFELVAE